MSTSLEDNINQPITMDTKWKKNNLDIYFQSEKFLINSDQ